MIGMDLPAGSACEKYLVVKGSGGCGLGDRLRAVISAVVYAQLSNRTLYIDWNDSAYGDGRMNYFGKLFMLEGVPTTSERPQSGLVRPVAWQDKLQLNWDQLYEEHGIPAWNRAWATETYSIDQGVLDWPEEVCVMWDFDQFSKFLPFLPKLYPAVEGIRSSEWWQSYVLRTHIKPADDIEKELIAHLNRLESLRPVVGVHVRASAEHFKSRTAPSVMDYVKAVRLMMRRSGACGIFLATDNRDVQDLFCKEFGQGRVMWLDKWLPEPGVALHLKNDCPDRLRSVRDALLDILLLASVDFLVTMGNSSFSILARMFSETTEKQRMTLMWRPSLLQRMLVRLGWNRKG